MWPYLYEPRSKSYDYDDSDSTGGESLWDLKSILLFPVIVLFMFLVGIAPFLVMAAYFLHDVYSTLKRTVDSGELCYPFLAKSGVVVTVILVGVYFTRNSPNTPFHFTASFVLGIGFVFIFTILPCLALCAHWIRNVNSHINTKWGKAGSYGVYVVCAGLILAVIIAYLNAPRLPVSPSAPPIETPERDDSINPTSTSTPSNAFQGRTITILADDFIPQPYQGDTIYFYNRIEGDRGSLNNSIISWDNGAVDISISNGNTWGGIWMSLNHPIREGQSVNFSAILPPQIQPAYQSRIIGINISIFGGTAGNLFRIELKDKDNNLQWSQEIILNGERQELNVDLPPLQDINHLVLVLDRALPGDYVVAENISFIASTPISDTPTAAFVWSYGMLLNNWNPSTGLVRDKARDASGEFDAIQATGSLAAATVLAEQIDVINREDAIAIVDKISDTLLNRLPRNHGLWPHWVRTSSEGTFEIVPNTEWSSVDTVIAAIGLLDAQQGLGLGTSGTEEFLREIEWDNLVTDKGISHGYTFDDQLIPYAWDVFGGESWLVELVYASVTGKVAPIAYPSAPTANGSGFIDELAWLYILPPSAPDYWGTDWGAYRTSAAEEQVSFYAVHNASACFDRFGLFGLSAAEAPVPARVPKENIYQAFGAGGQFSPAHDGSDPLGSPVVSPHYSAMIASLRPQISIRMWSWLINNGYFTPLNNVESLTFSAGSNCNSPRVEWNQLKGSWNLALQTLGWGRYLAERGGQIPVLWQATKANPFLLKGYLILAPNESSNSSQQNESLLTALENSNIACEDETKYAMPLAGVYRYRYSNTDGYTQYHSVEQMSDGQVIEYSSTLGWPSDPAVPYWISSKTTSDMDKIITRLGNFQALRFDTFKEYRIQTMNHSDPSGTVKRSEWYVCGIGLVRATMDYRWTYQTRTSEQASHLELVSFTPLP